ncbi:hypothetical protein HGRIS_013947 [Hohenbuehelia grisea]|uniref:Uncharacterized protein n=1 Tax=Hohenbuehelia grisea TaxID=104357 RepID=A0ABR3JU04_9AGAR
MEAEYLQTNVLRCTVPVSVDVLAYDMMVRAGCKREVAVKLYENSWSHVESGILFVNSYVSVKADNIHKYKEAVVGGHHPLPYPASDGGADWSPFRRERHVSGTFHATAGPPPTFISEGASRLTPSARATLRIATTETESSAVTYSELDRTGSSDLRTEVL